jgi:hypothetical protein
MFFDGAEAMFVARNAEGVEGGFLDENAARISHDAGGAEMVLVVITNAQGGIGNLQFEWSIVDDVEWLARRKRVGQIVDGGQVAG